uniref:Uncharacterized protein n=1 Tax=Rhizophora mucronata TaxID=61149 RepID=A0A2P2MIC0_RHIMU
MVFRRYKRSMPHRAWHIMSIMGQFFPSPLKGILSFISSGIDLKTLSSSKHFSSNEGSKILTIACHPHTILVPISNISCQQAADFLEVRLGLV